MGPTQVFYSFYARVLTVLAAIIAVLAVLMVAVSDGAGEALRVGVSALAVVYGIWLAFWAPRVEVSDGGIDVHNVARSTHIPWPALTKVRVRWSLEVQTTSSTVTAWSAPKSGVVRSRRGSTSGSAAEDVMAAITDRRAALRKAGYLAKAKTAGQPKAVTRWNTAQLAALGALLIAATTLWVV